MIQGESESDGELQCALLQQGNISELCGHLQLFQQWKLPGSQSEKLQTKAIYYSSVSPDLVRALLVTSDLAGTQQTEKY